MAHNGKWAADDMKKALCEVRTLNKSQKAAAKKFNIPRETLRRHLQGTNKFAKDGNQHFGRPPVLSADMEEDLKQHILTMESMLFGLTKDTVQKLAFQLAFRNNVPGLHHFNVEKESAGRYWFSSFMQRHPELSMRSAEGTSITRASGFNRRSVSMFFDIYIPLVDMLALTPDRLYNMDETSLSTVQKTEKIVSKRGKSQVGVITSAERRTSVTGVGCMSASGTFLPPMLIYKRKRMNDQLKMGAPAGTAFEVQDKGWMDSNLFVKWLKHFIHHVKPTVDNKVLLILDGHSSHVSNLEATNLARESGVIMLSLPPHCTHKMQPMDVGYYRPFKLYYNRAADRFMRTNPGRHLSVYDVPALLNQAFQQASVVQTAVNAFKKTGLFPPDRHVFTEADFMATTVAAQENSPPTGQPATSATGQPATSATGQPATSATGQPAAQPSATGQPATSATGQPAAQPSATGQPATQPSATSQPAAPPPATSQPATPATTLTGQQPEASSTSQPRTVVDTDGDGRCFFRSVAVCLNSALQAATRDEKGRPLDPAVEVIETMTADQLRSSMVLYMIRKIDTYSQLSPAVINSDLPPHIHCNSMLDRVKIVSVNEACVGELEVIATAEMLEQTITVLNEEMNTIMVYNDVYDRRLEKTVCLRFIAGEENAGHYQAVVVDDQQEHLDEVQLPSECHEGLGTQQKENMAYSSPPAPSTAVRTNDILPLPRKSPKVQTRKRRCQVPTLLTSSPHKTMLESRRAPGTKKPKNARPAKQQKKQFEDWTCFICQENRREAMTQCLSCGNWAHDMCTNQSNLQQYVCDLCI